MPASYEPLKICMTRPSVHSCSMAAQENGSERLLESRSSTRVSTLTNPPKHFQERIMCEALDDHEDIVVNAEEEEEAGVLIDRLDRTTTRYKMKIGPDKTKVMTNNPNGFQREIKIKGQRLEEEENFKYLGVINSNEGSKPEILSRIAQTQQLFLD